MYFVNVSKKTLTEILTKSLITWTTSVKSHHVMTSTYNRKFPLSIPLSGPHFIGSMLCQVILGAPLLKHNNTILTNNLLSLIVIMTKFPIPDITSSQIRILQETLGNELLDFIDLLQTLMPHDSIEFYAFVCIQTTTNLVKLSRIMRKLAIIPPLFSISPVSPSTSKQFRSDMMIWKQVHISQVLPFISPQVMNIQSVTICTF